jgi:hypothetical protein
MASKVLKFKLWEDDEGKKVHSTEREPGHVGTDAVQWKRNVVEIGGEVLCGKSRCSIDMSGVQLTSLSLTIHTSRIHQERQQT